MTAEHASMLADYPEYADAATLARHRTHRPALPAASMIVSLILHAILLTLGAIVVYEAATSAQPIARDVVMNFDSPGQGETPPTGSLGAGIRRPGDVAIVLSGGVGDVAPPVATESQPAPALTGLSSFTPTSLPGAALSAGESDLDHLFTTAADAAAEGGQPTETVTFAGLGASTARSVVYAVDCSGPMVTSLPMVLGEVRRSVSRLSPTQKFGVILFGRRESGPIIESFAPLLVRATPSAQDRLAEWLGTAEPSGASSPLAGLEAALALHPDAVFLLSRAIDRSGGAVWDGGLRATMARLDELNPADRRGRRAVSIQTIQFLDEDPTGILQAIGTQHGSGRASYRVIRRSEDLSSK